MRACMDISTRARMPVSLRAGLQLHARACRLLIRNIPNASLSRSLARSLPPIQAYDTTQWDELQKKHGNLEGVELGSDRCTHARLQDVHCVGGYVSMHVCVCMLCGCA